MDGILSQSGVAGTVQWAAGASARCARSMTAWPPAHRLSTPVAGTQRSYANVREIWPDGTASISRPYVRLDRQPEATRRAYAEECGIPLHELGVPGLLLTICPTVQAG